MFVLSAAFLITLTFIMIPGLINVAGEMSTTLKSAIPRSTISSILTSRTSKTDPAFATAEQNVKVGSRTTRRTSWGSPADRGD